MKIKYDSDHLRFFLVIYAVSFSLTIIRASETIVKRNALNNDLWAILLCTIGLRLIFSPEALSQYLLRVHHKGAPTRCIVLWHYPVLLLQASTTYAACYYLVEYGFAPIVMSLAIATVGINALWLTSMLWGAKRRSLGLMQMGQCFRFWAINNFSFCLLATAARWRLDGDWEWRTVGIFLAANTLIDLIFTAEWYKPLLESDRQRLPSGQ